MCDMMSSGNLIDKKSIKYINHKSSVSNIVVVSRIGNDLM